MHRPVKPVHVLPITLLCMVGFENNLTQMIVMIKQYVTNKKHVTRLKVKITVHS